MTPSLRQLRKWHRKLAAAHRHAVEVAEEAETTLGHNEAVIIMDPIIELHAALTNIEGRIEARAALAAGGKA